MLSLFTQVGIKCRVLPFFWFYHMQGGKSLYVYHRPLLWMMNTDCKKRGCVLCTDKSSILCIFLCNRKPSVSVLSDWELNSTQARCLSFTDWQQSDTGIRRSVDCTGFCSLLSWLVWICRCSSNPHHHWGKCCSIRIFQFVLSLLFMCTNRM